MPQYCHQVPSGDWWRDGRGGAGLYEDPRPGDERVEDAGADSENPQEGSCLRSH